MPIVYNILSDVRILDELFVCICPPDDDKFSTIISWYGTQLYIYSNKKTRAFSGIEIGLEWKSAKRSENAF